MDRDDMDRDYNAWAVPWYIPAATAGDAPQLLGEVVVSCRDEGDCYRMVMYAVRRVYGDVMVVCKQARRVP